MFDEQGELPTWVTSVSDQMEAAARDGDWPQFVASALDGWLVGFRDDEKSGHHIDFDHVMNAVTTLNYPATAMMAAEAIRRLYQTKDNT